MLSGVSEILEESYSGRSLCGCLPRDHRASGQFLGHVGLDGPDGPVCGAEAWQRVLEDLGQKQCGGAQRRV